MADFMERLSSLIEESGKSARVVAKATGVKANVISDYRNKARDNINIPNVCALADYFGVSLDYLFGRTECKSPDNDVQTAIKTTGLSENAVLKIQEYTMYREIAPDYVAGLEILFSSQHFPVLLSRLASYQEKVAEFSALDAAWRSKEFDAAMQTGETVKAAGEDLSTGRIVNRLFQLGRPGEEGADYPAYLVRRALDAILREVVKNGQHNEAR